MHRRRSIASFAIAVICLGTTAYAQPAERSSDQATQKKSDARTYFEKGLLLFDDKIWDAAFAEFQRSREIFPTRSATENAAICLRHLNRLDEALEMFEELLKFPNLPANERDLADREIRHLAGLVGTVELKGAEPGAVIVIDGRNRGATPVGAPLRVSAGTHVVRIYKEGFQSFEARVDVAGTQSKSIAVTLLPLTQAGRLKVTEQAGKVLEVVIDNVSVGQTPWEGPLAEGEHTVLLRGAGDVGTQPASVPVHASQLTPITLAAEDLTATLRVQPTPAGANVALDGVSVGRGLWEGRLRPGTHKIEVAAEGFVPQPREVTIGSGKREVLTVGLDRDASSPLWGDNRGHFGIEIDGALGLTPSFGGDVAGGCMATCSRSLGLGVLAVGHGYYRSASGFMFGVDAGYLYLPQKTTGRHTSLSAPPWTELVTANDTLTLGGVLLGASAGLRIGSSFPLTLRLGAGGLVGSLRDYRTGSFTTQNPQKATTLYTTQATASPTPSAYFLYLAPEARFGVRLGQSVEISAGIEALILLGLNQPTWHDEGKVPASNDGEGTFPADALSSKVIVAFTPGLGARYEF